MVSVIGGVDVMEIGVGVGLLEEGGGVGGLKGVKEMVGEVLIRVGEGEE